MSTALVLSASAADLSALPARLSEAGLAYLADEPPSRTLPLEALIPLVGDLLGGAAILMGHKNALADLDDLDFMARGVATTIQRRFGSFKFSELSQAVQRGASGEYLSEPGEYNQVALPCVVKWLEGYQTRARAEVVALLQRQAQAPALALPAPRRDLAAEVVALVAQAQAGPLPAGYELDCGNVLYDWLKALGAFRPFRTNEQLLDMRAEEVRCELERARQQVGSVARQQFNTFLSALEGGGLPPDHPLSRSVLNACKKRLLREWVRHHAEAGTDVARLLAALPTLA